MIWVLFSSQSPVLALVLYLFRTEHYLPLLALGAPWNVCQNIVFVSLFFSEVLLGLLLVGLNLAEVERMMLVRLFWFFYRIIVDMEIQTFHLLEYSGRIIRQGKGLYQLVWLF